MSRQREVVILDTVLLGMAAMTATRSQRKDD